MTHKRPSLVKILKDSFNNSNSGYNYEVCVESSTRAIKNGFFSRILDNFPPLLKADDMRALCNRYVDILRRLPQKDINEEFQITENSIRQQFDQMIIDIARIASKEMWNYSIYEQLNIEEQQKLNTDLVHDLSIAVTTKILKQNQSEKYLLLDEQDTSSEINNLIDNLITKIIDHNKENTDLGGFLVVEDKTIDQAIVIAKDLEKLIREVLLKELPQDGYSYIKDGVKKSAIKIIESINELAKKDYIISHATLNPEVCELLKLNPTEATNLLTGRTVSVTISYVAAVVADILKSTVKYHSNDNSKYTNSCLSLNIYLNDVKYHLVKQAMRQPDNTIDLNDPAANFRNGINYPLEHKTETAVATGLTLGFGVIGLGGFLLFKALSSIQESKDEEMMNIKSLRNH